MKTIILAGAVFWVGLAAGGGQAEDSVRPPAVAGAFYEGSPFGLDAQVSGLLKKAKSPEEPKLKIVTRVVSLPLEVLDAEGINRFADKALLDAEPLALWGEKYRRVVEFWRTTLLKNGRENGNGHHEAELFGVRLNGVILVGANAEVFSEFTDMLRQHSDRKIYLIGYANGDVGYLPTRAAYAEGGYEVEVAHMFYGGFRPKAGSLELLASAAADLVECLQGESVESPLTAKPPSGVLR